MGKPFQVTPQFLEQVAQNPAVRAALRAKAARMLPNAQRVAAQAGANEFGRSLRVEEGVRPGTKARGGMRRTYVRIVGDATDEVDKEDAGASLTRQQILRRASRA